MISEVLTRRQVISLVLSGDVPLGKFRLEGGTLIYEDRQHGDSERLDSVNLSIEWRSVRNPISVDGSGIWHGEQVSFSGGASTPFAYLNGDATPVQAQIEAAPISMIRLGRNGMSSAATPVRIVPISSAASPDPARSQSG